MPFLKRPFGVLALLILPTLCLGYVFNFEELLIRLQPQYQGWSQGYLQASIQFQEPSQTSEPKPVPTRRIQSFQLKFYWQGLQTRVTEIRDFQGRTVYMSYEDENTPKRVAHLPAYAFLKDEEAPLYFQFLQADRVQWMRLLEQLGIQWSQTGLYLSPSNEVWFQIGQKGEHAKVLLDRKQFQLQEIHTFLNPYSENPIPIEIHFQKMRVFEEQAFPTVTQYVQNGQWFKKVQVQSITFPEKLPFAALKQSMAEWMRTSAY